MQRPSSWPNKEVRGRLGETTRGSEYGHFYGVVSALTHPTAKAAMGTMLIDSDHLYAEILRAEPDEPQIKAAALYIAATAIFTCFALINANPPDALEPEWRQGVQELAQALTDTAHVDADWSHLDGDYRDGTGAVGEDHGATAAHRRLGRHLGLAPEELATGP